MDSQPNAVNKYLAYTWVAICLLALPEVASATPILNAINWVEDLLTSGIARSAAILAIAAMGYLAWMGQITGAVCGKFIAGIVLIFGGATLVDLIIGAVG